MGGQRGRAPNAENQLQRIPDHLAAVLPTSPWRTRFAPAPTGYLHLGHVANAICVWGISRANDGTVVLRVEDHDRGRCRPEYEAALLDDLDWLGFRPDVGTTDSFRQNQLSHQLRQSNNGNRYTAAMKSLADRDVIYPCTCSRRDIDAVSPSVVGEEPRYPGTCASVPTTDQQSDKWNATRARRMRMPDVAVTFTDGLTGTVTQTPQHQCGDLLIRDANGYWTYQFAVTVDDFHQDIDVVIRGTDLLASTARQMLVARALGRTRDMVPVHHPLIVHADGAKLSKANHDTSVRERRHQGATAAQLIGEAAYAVGLVPSPAPIHAEDVSQLFGVT